LTMIQMTSLWWLDISFSALASGQSLKSLFTVSNPYDYYHKALLVNLLTFFSLICITLIYILGDQK
jgi:hypothetical protein